MNPVFLLTFKCVRTLLIAFDTDDTGLAAFMANINCIEQVGDTLLPRAVEDAVARHEPGPAHRLLAADDDGLPKYLSLKDITSGLICLAGDPSACGMAEAPALPPARVETGCVADILIAAADRLADAIRGHEASLKIGGTGLEKFEMLEIPIAWPDLFAGTENFCFGAGPNGLTIRENGIERLLPVAPLLFFCEQEQPLAICARQCLDDLARLWA